MHFKIGLILISSISEFLLSKIIEINSKYLWINSSNYDVILLQFYYLITFQLLQNVRRPHPRMVPPIIGSSTIPTWNWRDGIVHKVPVRIIIAIGQLYDFRLHGRMWGMGAVCLLAAPAIEIRTFRPLG